LQLICHLKQFGGVSVDRLLACLVSRAGIFPLELGECVVYLGLLEDVAVSLWIDQGHTGPGLVLRLSDCYYCEEDRDDEQ
jgi:hypothetical protein